MGTDQKKTENTKMADNCALCGKKMNFKEKMYRNAYSHRLQDGVPCEKCDRDLMYLLMYLNDWTKKEEYDQAVGTRYKWSQEYAVPVEKAKAIFALRDMLCENFLAEIKADADNVFMVQENFQMPPSPAGIFILRARKIRNKMVVKGFSLKGTFQKGGKVFIQNGASIREAEILEAVPRETLPFTKDTFWSQLGSNVHDHTLSECEEGWLILNIDTKEECPEKGYLAGKQ